MDTSRAIEALEFARALAQDGDLRPAIKVAREALHELEERRVEELDQAIAAARARAPRAAGR